MPSGRALVGVLLLVVAAGCSSGSGATTQAAAPTLLAPAEFTAETKGLSTQLKWSVDKASVKPAAFTLFRNGVKIMELSGKTTEFEDPDLKPGKEYEYKLQAEAGDEQSERASAAVTMEALTLADARLDGYYNVDWKVTSQSGYSRLHKKGSDGWRFRPKCKTGPCDAKWEGVALGGAATRFVHKGAKYTGKWTGPFNVFCGKFEMKSTLTFKLEVTRARARGGEWVATRFKGTFDAREPAQLGCSGSSQRTVRFVGDS